MDDGKLFGRSDLVAFDGVENEAIGYWIEQRLLLPEPAGPRQHRRFNGREARIAAILGEARKIGLNVQAMRVIAAKVRRAIEYARGLGDTTKERCEVAARLGDEGQQRDFKEAFLGIDAIECDGHLILAPVGVGQWQAIDNMPEAGMPLDTSSVIVFDLKRILSPLAKQNDS